MLSKSFWIVTLTGRTAMAKLLYKNWRFASVCSQDIFEVGIKTCGFHCDQAPASIAKCLQPWGHDILINGMTILMPSTKMICYLKTQLSLISFQLGTFTRKYWAHLSCYVSFFFFKHLSTSFWNRVHLLCVCVQTTTRLYALNCACVLLNNNA